MVKKSINEKISKKSKVSKEKIISSDDETEYTLSDLDINLTPLPQSGLKPLGSSLGSLHIQPQQDLKVLENTLSTQLSTCTCTCNCSVKDNGFFHISLSKIKSLKELLTDELANEKSNQMIVDSLVDKISEMIKNIE